MKKEVEQFYKDIAIIEKVNYPLFVKLLAKFHVEVLPLIKYEEKNSEHSRTSPRQN